VKDDPINLFYHGKFSDSNLGKQRYGDGNQNNDNDDMINPLAPNYYSWKKDEK
jgi:hypothetical protein